MVLQIREGIIIDSTIIENVKLGDEDAFEVLYNNYKDKIYRTCWLITKDYTASEDILQEIFILVFKKIKKLKNVEAFQSWLYKITVNCCIKHIKKCKSQCITMTDDKLTQHSQPVTSDIPEVKLLYSEFNKEIMNIINELPLEKRATIILFYYNNLSIKEIAKIMGCFEGTVKSRLYNSKKLLEQKIKSSTKIKMEGMPYEY